MVSQAQVIFFEKVWFMFKRATVGIPITGKKKYRLSAEELVQQRNLSVLFNQCLPHLTLSGIQYSLQFVWYYLPLEI